MSTGGVFDNPAEVTHTEEGSYGTIWIVFHSCNSATLTYELYSNVTGSIPLERVVNDNVAQCEDWAEYF